MLVKPFNFSEINTKLETVFEDGLDCRYWRTAGFVIEQMTIDGWSSNLSFNAKTKEWVCEFFEVGGRHAKVTANADTVEFDDISVVVCLAALSAVWERELFKINGVETTISTKKPDR